MNARPENFLEMNIATNLEDVSMENRPNHNQYGHFSRPESQPCSTAGVCQECEKDQVNDSSTIYFPSVEATNHHRNFN